MLKPKAFFEIFFYFISYFLFGSNSQSPHGNARVLGKSGLRSSGAREGGSSHTGRHAFCFCPSVECDFSEPGTFPSRELS